jgi:hypothetical protein
MFYLLVKHRVADFAKWHAIFTSHEEAQEKAGLHLLHLLRDTSDPELVVLLFRTEDPARARGFTSAPEASQAAHDSGITGTPEILFLRD